jgi:hypothetical protein
LKLEVVSVTLSEFQLFVIKKIKCPLNVTCLEKAFEQIDVAAELKFQNNPAKVIDNSVSTSCIRLPLSMIIHLSREISQISNVFIEYYPLFASRT